MVYNIIGHVLSRHINGDQILTCACSHVYVDTCAHGHLCTWTPVCVDTCVHGHLCAWTPVYMDTCVHGHLCTSMCSQQFVLPLVIHCTQIEGVLYRCCAGIREDLGLPLVIFPHYTCTCIALSKGYGLVCTIILTYPC